MPLSTNLLIEMLMGCDLQVRPLEVLSGIKQVLHLREAGVLLRQEQERLEAQQGGGGAARFQNKTSLRNKHRTLTEKKFGKVY